MITRTILGGLPLLSFAAAHFNLEYPTARGFDEDLLGNFPCGGQDTVSAERTTVSTKGFPVSLIMGHDQTAVEVLLGLGNDPGSSFNIRLTPTFRAEGLGDLCLTSVSVPTDLNITDGTNATLQVVTSGDPTGGLYNCADLTFTTAEAPAPSSCTNGTGVTAVAFSGEAAQRNANVSTPNGEAQSGSSDGSSTTSSASSTASASASASASGNFAPMATAGTWGVIGAVALGALAAL